MSRNTRQNTGGGKKPLPQYGVKVKVVGVGGGGGNAISRMSKDFIRGVEFIAINTDLQDLELCEARKKIHIGRNLTSGLGAGMNPDVGAKSAEENKTDIIEALEGSDLLFLTAGFGGGTGTGALPVVAEIAKEMNILTIAVVTKPFSFEGSQRGRIASEGIARLKDKVDALIVVPNDRIFSVINKDTPIIKAFAEIDEILKHAVQGVVELIVSAGIINVDFADVRTIISQAGSAIVGIGVASGQERAVDAARQAINSPLLEVAADGAKGVLFGVSGGRDLKMTEINEAAKVITESVDPAAKIIFGAYNDKKLKQGQVKITLIATGFSGSRPAVSTLFNKESAAASREEASPGTSSIFRRLADNNFSEPAGSKDGLFDAAQKKDVKMDRDKKAESASSMWDIPTFLRRKKK